MAITVNTNVTSLKAKNLNTSAGGLATSNGTLYPVVYVSTVPKTTQQVYLFLTV